MQIHAQIQANSLMRTQQLRERPINCKYDEDDSGFKAWQSQSILAENNTDLLRNLKSQLVNYEQKYKRQNLSTLPVKLPGLDSMNKRKVRKINKRSDLSNIQNQKPLTQRQRKISCPENKDNLSKHRSIELGKRSQKSKTLFSRGANKNLNQSSSKLNYKKYQNNTYNIKDDKPIAITKVQEMKFTQNQKRVRKRDIYLAIFGERGKGKVQKITFEEDNKPYQIYLQRKNQNCKLATSTNLQNKVAGLTGQFKRQSLQLQEHNKLQNQHRQKYQSIVKQQAKCRQQGRNFKQPCEEIYQRRQNGTQKQRIVQKNGHKYKNCSVELNGSYENQIRPVRSYKDNLYQNQNSKNTHKINAYTIMRY